MNYDPTLIGALDPAQLTVATTQKLPRRALGRGTVMLLVLLRIYVLLAIPVVGYAFYNALQPPPSSADTQPASPPSATGQQN